MPVQAHGPARTARGKKARADARAARREAGRTGRQERGRTHGPLGGRPDARASGGEEHERPQSTAKPSTMPVQAPMQAAAAPVSRAPGGA